MERFIGLDYGDTTIGVAVSSPDGRVSVGVTTLRRTDADALRPSLKALKSIISEYGATCFVLGYPKNMDGTESARCEKTKAFGDKLGRYFKSIPVVLWDERLSTKAVGRVFHGKSERYKQHVDEMAAVYILQGYLDFMKNKEEVMENEQFEFENDDDSIVLVDDDGDELPLQILSSREDEGGVVYVLAADDEEGMVSHFKLQPAGDDEVIFELIDDEHEDFKRVFEMFKDDYESLGIDVEDIESN